MKSSNFLLKKSKFSGFLLTGLIFLYAFLYPPFLSVIRVDISFRLIIETFVLLVFLFTALLKIYHKTMIFLLMAVIGMFFCLLFSLDESRNVVSFFNKIFFFILLANAIHKNYRFNAYLKNVWVFVWIYFSISAIFVGIGFVTGLMQFSLWETGKHLYHFNLLVGTFIAKDIDIAILPRYTGWMCEPGVPAFFFGANIFIAQNLFTNKYRACYFKWINVIAGLLTFSVTFYLFLMSYFLYKKICVKKLKTVIPFLVLLSFPLVWYGLLYIFEQPEIFKYTSLIDRTWRYCKAWEVFTDMNISYKLFGYGILPLFRKVGGGVGSGLVGLLFGRGLLIFCLLIYLIFRYTKHYVCFFIYIIFYSLAFDLFSYPLFYIGLIISYESYFQRQILAHMCICPEKPISPVRKNES